jgi:hypothetical protein
MGQREPKESVIVKKNDYDSDEDDSEMLGMLKRNNESVVNELDFDN